MAKRKKYGQRIPLPVYGGIRAQGTRGAAGRPWWGRRWMVMMESLRLGPRLGRGRSYAIGGQVADLTLEPGMVSATVQGGASQPYRVSLTFATLNGQAQEAVIAFLARQPALLGKLLVNELPTAIEALFHDHGLALFPEKKADWQCRCTCLDWARPCKHITAILYLLGEAVEREPLLLLILRGLSRAKLVTPHACQPPSAAEPGGAPNVAGAPPGPPATDPACFWGDDCKPATDFGPAPGRGLNAPLAVRLGPLPFWRGHERFSDLISQVYERAGTMAPHVWQGERPALWRPAKLVYQEPAFHLRRRRLRIDETL